MSDEIACRLTKQACPPPASADPRRLSGPSLRHSLPTTARNLQFPPIDLIRKSRHRSADITGSHLAASEAWPTDITEPAFGEGKPGAYALTGRRQRREPDSPAAIDVPAVRPCWRWPGMRAPLPYSRSSPGCNRGTLRDAVGDAVAAGDDRGTCPWMRVVLDCGKDAPRPDGGELFGTKPRRRRGSRWCRLL